MKQLIACYGLLLVFGSGCVQCRVAAVPEIPDVIDQIKTKYTYRLIKPYELRESFEKAYPEVFSSLPSSIPILIQEGKYRSDVSGADIAWAALNGLLFAGSCFTFPVITSNGRHITYTVKIGEYDSSAETFDFYRLDNRCGSIGPIGLFFPYGEPKNLPHGRKFWRSYSMVFASDDEIAKNKKEDETLVNRALAYGVAAALKRLEDEGKINAVKSQKMGGHKRLSVNPPVVKPADSGIMANKDAGKSYYKILSCERESGNDFSYAFVLKLTDEAQSSLRAFRSVQNEFRNALKEDYMEAFSHSDPRSLYVDFPVYRQNEDRIEGRAVVLTIAVVALSYDPNTRKGILAVRVNANQYEEARKWVRKNIETLARDKNIALTTGEIPLAAKFYLGREELKDGNILEVEFRTE